MGAVTLPGHRLQGRPGSARRAGRPADPSTFRALFAALASTVDVDPVKVELGNRLYHDGRLSGDGSTSCATCHDLAAGGDDGLPTSLGIRGSVGPINAPTTLNAEFNLSQFWDGRAADLKDQAAGPVTNVLEMGATWESVIESLRMTPGYVEAFAAVYPQDGITKDTVHRRQRRVRAHTRHPNALRRGPSFFEGETP